MTRKNSHARILVFPDNQSPAGGQLDALHFETYGRRSDLIMDYQELQVTSQSNVFERDDRLWEQLLGVYIPRRLHFIDVKIIDGGELATYLNTIPPDHPTRSITSALAWRTPKHQNYYLFSIHMETYPSLLFIAQHCIASNPTGSSKIVSLVRNWSPPPQSPARLVPNPTRIHQYFGGNPISILLNGRICRQQLFISGVDIQGKQRPNVDVVLNLGETASRWATENPPLPEDRWDNKGEASEGMSVTEIADEARWVIQRLQANKRVLVHCAAGMNRSATVCCAVLILLEAISPESALERVREHHPWAKPDSHHWMALRRLAQMIGETSLKRIDEYISPA